MSDVSECDVLDKSKYGLGLLLYIIYNPIYINITNTLLYRWESVPF